jgi:hypothetical protein
MTPDRGCLGAKSHRPLTKLDTPRPDALSETASDSYPCSRPAHPLPRPAAPAVWSGFSLSTPSWSMGLVVAWIFAVAGQRVPRNARMAPSHPDGLSKCAICAASGTFDQRASLHLGMQPPVRHRPEIPARAHRARAAPARPTHEEPWADRPERRPVASLRHAAYASRWKSVSVPAPDAIRRAGLAARCRAARCHLPSHGSARHQGHPRRSAPDRRG